jgi:hypothetical protein
MKVIFLIVIMISIVSVLQAQDASKPATPITTSESGALKAGSIKDGKFVSDRHGISLAIPIGLHVVSSAENKAYNEAGVDLMKQGQGSNKRIEEAVQRTETLLGVATKPIGAPLNSALEIAAAKQERGVTARMVLAKNIMMFKGSSFSLRKALGNQKIGLDIYAAAEFDVSLAGINFFQRMYVTMHRGYSVVVQVTYHTDDQRVEMEKVLAKVVFAK